MKLNPSDQFETARRALGALRRDRASHEKTAWREFRELDDPLLRLTETEFLELAGKGGVTGTRPDVEEVRAVIAGSKPVAAFSVVQYGETLSSALGEATEAGLVVARATNPASSMAQLIGVKYVVAQTDENLDAYRRALQGPPLGPAREILMGRALGYADADIASWLLNTCGGYPTIKSSGALYEKHLSANRLSARKGLAEWKLLGRGREVWSGIDPQPITVSRRQKVDNAKRTLRRRLTTLNQLAVENTPGVLLRGTLAAGLRPSGLVVAGAISELRTKIGPDAQLPSWAHLRGENFDDKDLSGLLLQGVDFAGTSLAFTDFTGAKLSGAYLKDAAKILGTIFSGADLSGVHLEGAYLYQPRVARAILQGAHVEGTRFVSTDFRETDISNNVLRGALLDNCKVTKEQLRHLSDVQKAHVRVVPLPAQPTVS